MALMSILCTSGIMTNLSSRSVNSICCTDQAARLGTGAARSSSSASTSSCVSGGSRSSQGRDG